MKKTLFTIFVLGVFTFMCALSQASITDVDILPEEPTEIDPITIFVSGEENYSVSVTDSILTINETLLELDIYLHLGFLPAVTPWSQIENIGVLSLGTYDLTVNTFVDSDPMYNDTFSTSFEVVPEPTTILFLALGMFMVREKRC